MRPSARESEAKVRRELLLFAVVLGVGSATSGCKQRQVRTDRPYQHVTRADAAAPATESESAKPAPAETTESRPTQEVATPRLLPIRPEDEAAALLAPPPTTVPNELPVPKTPETVDGESVSGARAASKINPASAGTPGVNLVTPEGEGTAIVDSKAITSSEGRQTGTLTGEVYQFRKNWRLRYAPLDAEDAHGGSVILNGNGLELLQEGQRVRVVGAYRQDDGVTRFSVQTLDILER